MLLLTEYAGNSRILVCGTVFNTVVLNFCMVCHKECYDQALVCWCVTRRAKKQNIGSCHLCTKNCHNDKFIFEDSAVSKYSLLVFHFECNMLALFQIPRQFYHSK